MWSARAALALACLITLACHETGQVKVASLTFEGNQAFSDGDLAGLLVTRKSGRWPWSERRYFNRDVFDADLQRITGFYTDRGYPEARVASVDVDFTTKKDAVRLTIEIDEGQPLVVEAVEVTGLESVSDDVREAVTDLPLKAGAPRDRALAAASRESLVYGLRDRGFAHARVAMTERPGTQPRTVVLQYVTEPGPETRFGPTEVVRDEGTASVDPSVVRRSLLFRPGDLFRESLVLESQRRLNGLGLFDFALIAPKPPPEGTNGGDPKPPVLPMLVTVAEAKPQRYQFGIGYGTEDGPRGSFEWTHLNLFGGAQQITLETRYSSRLKGAGVEFSQPYFLTRRLSYTARLGTWWTEEPTYNSKNRGGRFSVAFQREVGRGMDLLPIDQSVRLGYSNESLSYSISPETLADLTQLDQLIGLGLDPVLGRGAGRLASIDLDIDRRAIDHPLDPHSGYTLSGHLVHSAPWLGGTFRFDEIDAEGAVYVPVGARMVWASRARAGSLFARDAAAVPVSERYFLGGSTSMRGWGRYQVSPLTTEGLPIGGRGLLDTTTELRLMFGERYGAVVFIDAGQVWADSAGIGSSPLLVAAGPGLRWISPIGIVRADFGMQLRRIPGLLVNGEPETRHWRIHFSIGHAF
jgi:outer membrane protein assembly complex protein YaeT